MIESVRTFASVSWAAFREVAGNPGIRRIEIAWASYGASKWALAIALLVFAYEVGGALGVATLGVVQMLPSAIVAPIVAGLGDRFRRQRVLTVTYALSVLGCLALAVVLQAGRDVVPVYLLAGLAATLGSMVRPNQAALLPALARSPGELVAANVVSSTAEGIGALAGPAIGAAVLIIGGPTLVALVAAVGLAIAALAVARIDVALTVRPAAERPESRRPSLMATASEGVRALSRLPAPRLLISTFATQAFVRGMLTVLLVVVAVSALGLGQSGVGTLNAAIGAGGLVGAVLAIGLVGRRRLAPVFALALVGWGMPIMALGLWPHPVLAVVVLAALGLSNAFLDVSGFTLLQGTVPDRVRAGVLGVLEGLIGLAIAVGGVAASLLVDRLGLEGALVVTGAILPLLAVVLSRALRRLDDQVIVPRAQLDLLRGIPMFAPLSLAVMEQLAAGLTAARYPAGTEIIREGEVGDAFYLIADGTAEVTEEGRHRRDLGPGESCGEIALMRGVPRTATVRASSDVQAYRLAGAAFLSAVTGNPYSRSAADRLVEDLTAVLTVRQGAGDRDHESTRSPPEVR